MCQGKESIKLWTTSESREVEYGESVVLYYYYYYYYYCYDEQLMNVWMLQ